VFKTIVVVENSMENFLYNVSERTRVAHKLTSSDLVATVQLPVATRDPSEFEDIDDTIEEVLWENTVKELLARLRTAGVKIPKGARKADLIDLVIVHGLAYSNDDE